MYFMKFLQQNSHRTYFNIIVQYSPYYLKIAIIPLTESLKVIKKGREKLRFKILNISFYDYIADDIIYS